MNTKIGGAIGFAVILLLAQVGIAAPQESNTKASVRNEKTERKESHNERWFVRNGLDEGAKAVAKTKPITTTVDLLTKLPSPKAVPKGGRVAPVETTSYSVTAQLVRYNRHRDGDFQFVLRDAKTGATVICEIPDPDEVRQSPFHEKIVAARKTFQKRFVPFDVVQTPAPILVRVTGIGYFGKVGGTNGSDKAGAKNGVQLHPVTGFALMPRSK